MTTSMTPAGSGMPSDREPDQQPVPAEVRGADAVVSADLVGAGRVTMAGQYLAGLLAAGAAASVSSPRALVRDLWPGVDPAVVQEIFDRGVATGWSARGLYGQRRFQAEDLVVQRARLEEAGWHAMGGVVGRSVGLVARAGEAHPADTEFGREHTD